VYEFEADVSVIRLCGICDSDFDGVRSHCLLQTAADSGDFVAGRRRTSPNPLIAFLELVLLLSYDSFAVRVFAALIGKSSSWLPVSFCLRESVLDSNRSLYRHLRLRMSSLPRHMSSTRPRSKSSASENALDRKLPELPTVDSPQTPPSATASPAQKFTSLSPRKNGRRRYTSRQVPLSPYRAPQTPDNDVSNFVALTEHLNGRMDGLVEYHFNGGRWERFILL
jgi:hypothetical protein